MRIASGVFIGIVMACMGWGVSPGKAAQREVWSRKHDLGVGDRAQKVQMDARGDVIYLWRSGTNAFLVKSSGTTGAVKWEAEIPAEVWTFEVDSEGNSITTGKKKVANGEDRIYIGKYAAETGAELWHKELGEPGTTTVTQNVRVDPSGNVVLLGAFNGVDGGFSWLVEYASTNGAVRWEKRIDEHQDGPVSVSALALGVNGDVAVGGTIYTNLYVAKFAGENGERIWARYLSHTNTLGAFISTVAVDAGGNVAVTGGATWTGTQRSQAYTGRFAAENGNTFWEVWRARSLQGEETGIYVLSTEAGDVVMVGVHSRDVLIARYRAADGSVMWEKNLYFETGVGNWVWEEPSGIALDADGNLLVGVAAPNYNLQTFRSKTVKLDAAFGTQLWDVIHMDEYIRSIAIGANDHFVVSGQKRVNTVAPENDAVVRLFRVGPELTIQNGVNDLAIGWELQYSGWSLQRLITTDSGSSWENVLNPQESTTINVPVSSAGHGIFRLVKN
jgi:hypothetical protein